MSMYERKLNLHKWPMGQEVLRTKWVMANRWTISLLIIRIQKTKIKFVTGTHELKMSSLRSNKRLFDWLWAEDAPTKVD